MLGLAMRSNNWVVRALLAVAVASPGLAAVSGPPRVSTAVAHPLRWPRASSPAAITDPATERRITAIIARLTPAQKVGQIIQADISAIAPADLDKYPLGSILAGGNSGPNGDERADAATWAAMVRDYRQHSTANSGIPILFGVDAVHGHSNLPGATIFPHNIALGATRDPALVRRIGEITAEEVSASGIEWTFAPTLAVPQDLRWGRSYEGYSSDPALVAAYSRQMILGLQGPLRAGRPIASNHVAATAKHFLGDGGTFNGKDQGNAKVDEAVLIARHAAGYPPAIDAGALTVMLSFSSWNGVKNHGNRSLVTGVLKSRMGFAGLVVGDWNAHGQVDGCTTVHCPQAINAGLDLFMAPDSWKQLFDNTLADVEAGRIAPARLDDAVRRILRVKAKLGLLDGRTATADPSAIGTAAHRAVAREAVAKSLVLLKNRGAILPIRAGARVLVAGAGANDMARQAGGWTISWQGDNTTAADFPNGETIWTGLQQAVTQAGGTASLSANGSFAERPDVAIVVYGEPPYAEFLGDVPTLAYQPQGKTDLALIKRLKAAGIPVVSLFLSGRPLFTSAEINASDAFVAGWLPGTEGGGVADVLVAQRGGSTARPFSGKLPYAWPADARSPVRTPLYPRGFGLTYGYVDRGGLLSEDPRVDLDQALNGSRYFVAGKILSPWAVTVSDAGGSRPFAGSTAVSPEGLVSLRRVDGRAQEDSIEARFTSAGSLSFDGPPVSIAQQQARGDALILDLTVVDPPTGTASLSLGDRPFDVTAQLQQRGPAVIRIPLKCFADSGADLTRLGNAARLSSSAPAIVIIHRVEVTGSDQQTCPPRPR